MTFPWLTPTVPRPSGDRCLEAQKRELRDRAALFFRLGYSEADATARLVAAVAWEHDSTSSAHKRPDALSDAAIGELVKETYKRRPSGTL